MDHNQNQSPCTINSPVLSLGAQYFHRAIYLRFEQYQKRDIPNKLETLIGLIFRDL